VDAPATDTIRAFWERRPVGAKGVPRTTSYDFFRRWDAERETYETADFESAFYGYERGAGMRVLDLGCGNGYTLARYARHRARVTGVDLTATALRLASERFALLRLPVSLAQTDGVTLPFADASFDIVTSIGVLHHIPAVESAVREIHRVLKPGGSLRVMLYARRSFRYHVTFRYRALGPWRGRTAAERVALIDGVGNPYGRVYTRAEARHLLRDFTDQRMTVGFLPPDELVQWVPVLSSLVKRLVPLRALRPLERCLGWNLYVAARKPA
jgi:SAM-dependent methyltransferase